MSKVNRSAAMVKFLVASIIGITVFFIPIVNEKTPLVWLIGFLKKLFGSALAPMVVVLIGLIAVTAVLSFSNKFPKLQKFYENDGVISKIMFVLALVFGIMILTGNAPRAIMNPNVGPLSLSLTASVFLTVTSAGMLIIFISEFGLLQMIGTLIEPIMRPLYKLPGYAALDGITSFVCAPAVGVFLTNKLYVNKLYTSREAASIATNFSVCSLGFFLVLCEWGKIPHLYTEVVLTSFITVFLIAPIIIRIPPISLIANNYIDGTPFVENKEKISYSGIFGRALDSALDAAASVQNAIYIDAIKSSFIFGVKIAGYVLCIATISLFLAEETPIFTWIGLPMVPILNLLGIPNATEAAPSILVGITEIGMPVLLLAGKNVAEATVFFVVTLSTTQIIFFTESANAIMESNIPLGFTQLVIIFLERTALSMPIIAIATHILF